MYFCRHRAKGVSASVDVLSILQFCGKKHENVGRCRIEVLLTTSSLCLVHSSRCILSGETAISPSFGRHTDIGRFVISPELSILKAARNGRHITSLLRLPKTPIIIYTAAYHIANTVWHKTEYPDLYGLYSEWWTMVALPYSSGIYPPLMLRNISWFCAYQTRSMYETNW